MSQFHSAELPFVSELRATGHGEIWDHTDAKKFEQFGWRCTNTESSYEPAKTLIGNWNERRFDINEQSKAKPIPSQVSSDKISWTSTVFISWLSSCPLIWRIVMNCYFSLYVGVMICFVIQFNHYFETTYGKSYSGSPDVNKVPAALKHLEGSYFDDVHGDLPLRFMKYHLAEFHVW